MKSRIIALAIIILSIGSLLIGGDAMKANSNQDKSLFLISVNEKYGYIDKKGTVVIPPKFIYAEQFSEGMAVIGDGKGKSGYIDTKGSVVVKPTYDQAFPFSEGLGSVGVIGKDRETHFRYIDKMGKTRIDGDFRFALPFSEGMAAVDVADHLLGEDIVRFIDKQGDLVSEPFHVQMISPAGELFFHESKVLLSQQNEKLAYYDRSGQRLFNTEFDHAKPFAEGVAAACIYRDEIGCGYIDKNGKWTIKPVFAGVDSFSEGMAAVLTSVGKVGYINKSGKLLFTIPFENADLFHEGRAAVVDENDKWGFIDTKGKIIVKPQFDSVESYSNGLAKFELEVPSNKDGEERIKIGYIDSQGKVVWKARY